jgi:hypothetical protein
MSVAAGAAAAGTEEAGTKKAPPPLAGSGALVVRHSGCFPAKISPAGHNAARRRVPASLFTTPRRAPAYERRAEEKGIPARLLSSTHSLARV